MQTLAELVWKWNPLRKVSSSHTLQQQLVGPTCQKKKKSSGLPFQSAFVNVLPTLAGQHAGRVLCALHPGSGRAAARGRGAD